MPHPNKVIQLDSPRRIEFHFFQCLAHDIVRLSLAGLGCLDGSRLVDISLVVYIQLTKGILQTKNLILLELRVFPASSQQSRWIGHILDVSLPLQFDDVHCGRLVDSSYNSSSPRSVDSKMSGRQKVGNVPMRGSCGVLGMR